MRGKSLLYANLGIFFCPEKEVVGGHFRGISGQQEKALGYF